MTRINLERHQFTRTTEVGRDIVGTTDFYSGQLARVVKAIPIGLVEYKNLDIQPRQEWKILEIEVIE